MRHKHAYEEEKVMGSPPEIEPQHHDTGKDFGRASDGTVGRRRPKKPSRNRAYLVLEGIFFEGEEGDIATVVEDDALPIPEGIFYGGHASLAHGQGRDVRCDGA